MAISNVGGFKAAQARPAYKTKVADSGGGYEGRGRAMPSVGLQDTSAFRRSIDEGKAREEQIVTDLKNAPFRELALESADLANEAQYQGLLNAEQQRQLNAEKHQMELKRSEAELASKAQEAQYKRRGLDNPENYDVNGRRLTQLELQARDQAMYDAKLKADETRRRVNMSIFADAASMQSADENGYIDVSSHANLLPKFINGLPQGSAPKQVFLKRDQNGDVSFFGSNEPGNIFPLTNNGQPVQIRGGAFDAFAQGGSAIRSTAVGLDKSTDTKYNDRQKQQIENSQNDLALAKDRIGNIESELRKLGEMKLKNEGDPAELESRRKELEAQKQPILEQMSTIRKDIDRYGIGASSNTPYYPLGGQTVGKQAPRAQAGSEPQASPTPNLDRLRSSSAKPVEAAQAVQAVQPTVDPQLAAKQRRLAGMEAARGRASDQGPIGANDLYDEYGNLIEY